MVSHRSFYNKSYNITIAILPFFISTIILCLQSNLVITLGTIGALAIIRFRTSVKDPVDMLYLLWSVFIGIICGCQLFEVGVLTSVFVTLVLIALEHLNFGRKPFVLIVRSTEDVEADCNGVLNLNLFEMKVMNEEEKPTTEQLKDINLNRQQRAIINVNEDQFDKRHFKYRME